MWQTRVLWWTGTLTLLVAGCASGPLQDNPVLVRPEQPAGPDAPVWIMAGPRSYGLVFEGVLNIVNDYFEIAYSNRYDGRIETFPRVAPGLGQPWKPGSPDFYQRLLASFQSIRLRAIVLIRPAEADGYFVDVKVYRELEDVAQPTRSTAGSAIFISTPTVERQNEVVDATTYENVWIPIGRDCKLEQCILDRIAHLNLAECKQPPVQPAP